MYTFSHINELTSQSAGGGHIPVLRQAVVEYLVTAGRGVYVDCTVGSGGHAEALLQQAGEQAMLIGLDVDAEAVAMARRRLKRFGHQAVIYQTNFSSLDDVLQKHKAAPVVGVLFDLGLSSLHIDQASRGFSYRADGPLDMRMDHDLRRTARDVVNWYTRNELVRVFRDYGEERYAAQISRAIIRAREGQPIETTLGLARVIQSAIPGAQPQKTLSRIFQAIRIEVNDELSSLKTGLSSALEHLETGGRIVVISYHSLEDRIVKSVLAQKAKGCICPPDLPQCSCGRGREFRLVTRGALRPGPEEIDANPRARSARLRAAEKL
jgi:16S rRNA (cytosine1402-N4)-methyltransferase